MWIAERGQVLDFSMLVDPNTTALLLIDVQNDFCHPDGLFGRVGHDNSRMPALAAALQRLLTAARERQVFTVFIRATYDQEVTSLPLARHRSRLGLLESVCLEGSWGADWYGDIVPARLPSEVIITKHRFDAFQGTPLDLYLRNNGIATVIATGVATSGCVESTVRDAFFLDYNVVVPRDGVSEPSQEDHDSSVHIMERTFATITNVDAIVAAWRMSNVPIEPSWKSDVASHQPLESAAGLLLLDSGALKEQERLVAERLADAARAAGVPIFRVRSTAVSAARTPWTEIDTPMPSPHGLASSDCVEMHVTKLRRSAFADTRLRLLLRTNQVRHLVVAGAESVPGSLAATILDALDADYTVTVVSDLAGDNAIDLARTVGAQVARANDILARWQAVRVRTASMSA
jgi:ureidoacrylate peracid hydrolase